jgi:glutaminyl-peptide cyclotransferase
LGASCRGPSVPTAVPVTVTANELGTTKPENYTYEIVNTYAHDPNSFTQGLVFEKGVFYESSGLNEDYGGHSSLRKVEVETGKVLKKIDVSEPYFAEGLALFQGRLFQLTWQHHKGFIYDRDSFALEGEFKYSGEGWGLTHDGKSLIMSDGTNQLRFLDPTNFQEQRRISVFDQGRAVDELNELEYVKGEIFANIWQDDLVLRLDPKDGRILGVIDFTDLKARQNNQQADVLNGIAYDPDSDKLYITGKKWSKLFEVRLKKK